MHTPYTHLLSLYILPKQGAYGCHSDIKVLFATHSFYCSSAQLPCELLQHFISVLLHKQLLTEHCP